MDTAGYGNEATAAEAAEAEEQAGRLKDSLKRLQRSGFMPIGNAPYRVVLANGQEYSGKLDKDGKAVLKNINASEAEVYFGYSEDEVKLPEIDAGLDYSEEAVRQQLAEMDADISGSDLDAILSAFLDTDLDYTEK